MAYYTFDELDANILSMLVGAAIRNESLPTQTELSRRTGVSQATISNRISELTERRKYDNCPYLEKHGNRLGIAYPDEILRETKKAVVLYAVHELAEKHTGHFDVLKLKEQLINNAGNHDRFVYTEEYVDKALAQFLKPFQIIWLDEETGKWRLNVPLFEAERQYLEKVLKADPIFEILPIRKRKGKKARP